MKILSNILLILNLLLISVTVLANQNIQLPSYTAKYIAYHDDDDVGSASLSLKKIEDDRYKVTYESRISKFFLSDNRKEESVFYTEGEKLVPETYFYARTGTGRNKSLAVLFDAANEKIKINDEVRYDWNGELDNQLFRIDLSNKLANNVSNLDYDFINYRGEKRYYRLEVVGEEEVSLPYGNLTAVKVQINRESNKRKTFAWFSPDLNWSLVRLQQFKEGKEQGDIRLTDYTQHN